MKKASTVKNISNSPVLLNNEDGISFVLAPGRSTGNYRKDSRFNDAHKQRRIKEEAFVVEEDDTTDDEDENEGSVEEGVSEPEEDEESVDEFFFEAPLSELPPSVQESLFNAGYSNHADVQRSTDDELKSISGIGSARLDEIRDLVGRAGVGSNEDVSDETPEGREDNLDEQSEAESLETEDALS